MKQADQREHFIRRLFSKETFKRAVFLMEYHDPDKGVKSFKKEDYLPLFLVFLLIVLVSVFGYFVFCGIAHLLR